MRCTGPHSAAMPMPDPANSKVVSKNECYDVVIVGAGASGMECALSLLARSPTMQIVILEGSDRIGGRIFTTTESISVNGENLRFPYDHGAAWVHGTKPDEEGTRNPMLDYISDAKCEVVAPGNPWVRPRAIMHGADCMYLYRDRDLIENWQSCLEEHESRLKHVSDCATEMHGNGRGIDTTQCGLAGFLPQTSSLITEFFFHLISLWNGCDATSKLQLADFATDNIDDSQYTPMGDFPGPHCTVETGMGGIVEAMLSSNKQLVDLIRLNRAVTCVSLESSPFSLEHPISITTLGNERIYAKHCVLTVSAGCLQAFLNEGRFFGNPLSASKVEAISVIEMGSYKKVFLAFDSIQWPIDRPFIGLVLSDPHPLLGHFLLVDNLWASKSIPALEAILVGTAAEWSVGKPDNIIKTAVVEFLKAALPCDESTTTAATWAVVSTHVSRWEEDPLFCGAYSHMKLGALGRHGDALRASEWDGRLLIAGESTVSEYEGSVHAALFSGRYAAEQILQSKWMANKSVDVEEELAGRT